MDTRSGATAPGCLHVHRTVGRQHDTVVTLGRLAADQFVQDVVTHAIERGICLGYITGVAEYVLPNLGFEKVCPPEGVLTGHSIDIVMSYAKAHPEDGHLHSITLITHALSRAWPCNREKH